MRPGHGHPAVSARRTPGGQWRGCGRRSKARGCYGLPSWLAVQPGSRTSDTHGPAAVSRPPQAGSPGWPAVLNARLRACRPSPHPRRYIFCSILHCDKHPEVPLMNIKHCTEQFLAASGLNYTVFRICGFMQARCRHRTSMRLAALPPVPLGPDTASSGRLVELGLVWPQPPVAVLSSWCLPRPQAIIGNYAVPILEEKPVWGTTDQTRTAYMDTQVCRRGAALAAMLRRPRWTAGCAARRGCTGVARCCQGQMPHPRAETLRWTTCTLGLIFGSEFEAVQALQNVSVPPHPPTHPTPPPRRPPAAPRPIPLPLAHWAYAPLPLRGCVADPGAHVEREHPAVHAEHVGLAERGPAG